MSKDDERSLVRDRVALAMTNSRTITREERDRVEEAMQGAPLWGELPADVIELIEGWEDEAGFGA